MNGLYIAGYGMLLPTTSSTSAMADRSCSNEELPESDEMASGYEASPAILSIIDLTVFVNTKDNPPCNTLFIGNLGESINEEELRGLFTMQPGFKQMKVLRQERHTVCFIEFEDVNSATNVHHSLQGAVIPSSGSVGMRIQYPYTFLHSVIGLGEAKLHQKKHMKKAFHNWASSVGHQDSLGAWGGDVWLGEVSSSSPTRDFYPFRRNRRKCFSDAFVLKSLFSYMSFVLSIAFSLTSENIFEEPVWEKEGRWLPWLKWIAGSYYLPVAGRGCNVLTKKNILGCILLPGMHPSYHLGGYGHVAALVCSFIYVVIYHSVIMIILMICLVPIKAIVWSLRDYGADSDNRTFRDQMHYDGDSLKSILLKGQISTSVDGIKGLTAFFFEATFEKRVNLDRKGIDVGSVLCPICEEDVETVNHIFFTCDMAKDLWALLARWWKLDIPVCANILEWFQWLDSLHVSN
ncbi:cell wall integrity protein SCW1 [Tanacetum coccineum]